MEGCCESPIDRFEASGWLSTNVSEADAELRGGLGARLGYCLP